MTGECSTTLTAHILENSLEHHLGVQLENVASLLILTVPLDLHHMFTLRKHFWIFLVNSERLCTNKQMSEQAGIAWVLFWIWAAYLKLEL